VPLDRYMAYAFSQQLQATTVVAIDAALIAQRQSA
jgi:hypothetical protein